MILEYINSKKKKKKKWLDGGKRDLNSWVSSCLIYFGTRNASMIRIYLRECRCSRIAENGKWTSYTGLKGCVHHRGRLNVTDNRTGLSKMTEKSIVRTSSDHSSRLWSTPVPTLVGKSNWINRSIGRSIVLTSTPIIGSIKKLINGRTRLIITGRRIRTADTC